MHLKYKFEMMKLEDQIIAVPVGENVNDYHGVVKLNETAAFIFKILQNETTEEAIVDALKKEYEVPLDDLLADVHNCITEFQKKGLLS